MTKNMATKDQLHVLGERPVVLSRQAVQSDLQRFSDADGWQLPGAFFTHAGDPWVDCYAAAVLGLSRSWLGLALGLERSLTGKDAKNPVFYPSRKNIRPLVDGLVSNADFLGCGGDGTAQQFDGF